MGSSSPAFGQVAADNGTTNAPPITVAVISAQTALSKEDTMTTTCWGILIPEQQVLLREHNAQSWLLKNLFPLTGAAMGGASAGLLLKRHAKAAVFKRWGVSAMVGGAGAGFLLGPGGVLGAVLGGGLAEILGKRKLPITVGGAIGGALAGKAVWDKVFPPYVPPAPSNDPDGDIPFELFLREQACGNKLETAYTQSTYRVTYRFNDEEFTIELPYDPGEALLVDAMGEVKGPARVRLD